MPRGRPAIPTAIKKAKGNGKTDSGKRKIGVDPSTVPGPPPMPQAIASDPGAKAAWAEIVSEAPAGIITHADGRKLTVLAKAWSKWEADDAEMSKTGSVVLVNGQPQRTPYFESWHRNAALCLKLLDDFGMSPIARAKFAKPPEAKPADDSFDDLDRGA